MTLPHGMGGSLRLNTTECHTLQMPATEEKGLLESTKCRVELSACSCKQQVIEGIRHRLGRLLLLLLGWVA